MVSEKLDRVLAAEEAAAQKIRDAENKAQEILDAAKAKAAEITEQNRSDAKSKAAQILDAARNECNGITEEYASKADADAERIARDAAKNEMYGINTVIMKIIP